MPTAPSNHLFSLLDCLPIPALVIQEKPHDAIAGDRFGDVLYSNLAFARETGYSQSEIPTCEAFFERAYPIESYRRKVSREWKEALQTEVSDSNTTASVTSKIFCKDGDYKWFEVTTEPDHSLQPDIYILVLKDITKLHDMYDDLKTKTLQISEQTTEIEVLRKIIPICSICKRIKDDDGYWHAVETYIKQHSGADLSHSLCFECLETHYPDINAKMKEKDLAKQGSDS